MTVQAVSDVKTRMFSGYPDDPGLPLGTWAVSAGVIGDASGGNRSIEVDFQPGSIARASLCFSLEEFYLTDTDNNAKVAEFRSLNMERLHDSELVRRATAPLIAGLIVATLDPAAVGGIVPMFMGYTGSVGAPAGFLVIATNVAGLTLLAVAGGYYWGPRSINAVGGPRRPITGLNPAG
jgi:hypothetical protein